MASPSLVARKIRLRQPFFLAVYLTGIFLIWFEVMPASARISKEAIVQVALDIYSGRVNPTWELSSNESVEFLKLFRELPEAPAGPVWDGLGYRGLLVSKIGGTVADFDSLRIFKGIVIGKCQDREKLFLDRDRSLERWLFHTSQGRLDEELRTYVARELEN
jgi:hypothetical protein